MSVNVGMLMGVTVLGHVMYMCLALGNVSASATCDAARCYDMFIMSTPCENTLMRLCK